MKKMIFLMSVLLAWTTSLSAQITREQADAIVWDYLQNEEMPSNYSLHVNVNTPNEDGFVVTTYKEETVKVKYACWVYFVRPNYIPAVALPVSYCYLFVKEDTGSLLEIITNNDFGPGGGLTAWTTVKAPSGIAEQKENNMQLYPNPVDNWLTIPCEENTRIEIRDLKGSLLYSGLLSGKDARLNVSFLNAGLYLVTVEEKTYKIIKN